MSVRASGTFGGLNAIQSSDMAESPLGSKLIVILCFVDDNSFSLKHSVPPGIAKKVCSTPSIVHFAASNKLASRKVAAKSVPRMSHLLHFDTARVYAH